MIKSFRPGQVLTPGRLRLAAVSLVCTLPFAASCTQARGETEAPVVGSWKSRIGTIQFLGDGTLRDVSLLPAVCEGKESAVAVPFTGTWRHETLSDAGPGAAVDLTSTAGDLTCKRFFVYYKGDGPERLQLTVTKAGREPFVRQ
ncbi:hypothetical protein [Kitasatospora sp. NPDC002965]|uniref:hypothetical protein n=1 Tax=Kitasatospora sp. NPDC002965 TaxID=3154775 RepID=UPI0033AB693F